MLKYVTTLLIILLSSQLFSKTYIEEKFENTGWSPSLSDTGYGASEMGARKEALAKCSTLISSLKSQCQKDKGSFSNESCTTSTTQFRYGVYDVDVNASGWCATGKKVISWRGASVVRSPSDFKAISDCRNEIYILKDKCITQQRGEIQVGLEQQCQITRCDSSECIAHGYFHCVDL